MASAWRAAASYFPGHMQKTVTQMRERLSHVDIVLEVFHTHLRSHLRIKSQILPYATQLHATPMFA